MNTIALSNEEAALIVKRHRKGKPPFTVKVEGVSPLITTFQVLAALKCGRNALWEEMKKDDFPPHIRIGKENMWRASDIDAYIEKRLNEAKERKLSKVQQETNA